LRGLFDIFRSDFRENNIDHEVELKCIIIAEYENSQQLSQTEQDAKHRLFRSYHKYWFLWPLTAFRQSSNDMRVQPNFSTLVPGHDIKSFLFPFFEPLQKTRSHFDSTALSSLNSYGARRNFRDDSQFRVS
jgi:hypothetical protein